MVSSCCHGRMGGAHSPSLGQPSSQNSWHWNILGLYDLCWRPDGQASSQDLFKVGASLNLWSCLAGARAKRSVVAMSLLEGWPVTPLQPGRTESPERGWAYRGPVSISGERGALAQPLPPSRRTPGGGLEPEASGPCWAVQVKTQPWGHRVTISGKKLALS